MKEPIDFAHIEKMFRDNPDDWYTTEEANARMEACLQKALNVTGPRVTAVDLSGGGFRVEVDFDVIVKRGRDLQQ